jgi:diguanylate cyclase (GGDEF)-like protein
MTAMDRKDLIGRINQVLGKETARAIPLDDLSGVELTAAIKINDEIRRAARFEEIARGSLDVMEKAEGFSGKIIRVISAMIRLNMMGTAVEDIGALSRNIVEIIAKELEFDNCSLMLKVKDSDCLELVAGCGKGDKYRRAGSWKTGARFRTGEGVAGRAFASGKPVFIADITGDETFKAFDSRVKVKSILSVPVTSGEERLGVINFSHPQQGNIYDTDLEKIMMLLAGFVGQIIALSKFYNDMIQWNENLKDEVSRKTIELTRKNRKLRKLALIDPLTGIFNRRFFFKRLEEEFLRSQRYGEQFSLLFIDIDNLKPINDLQGHVIGDRVIRLLANCMKDVGRKGDVASRLGGDEFGYVLLESNPEGAYNFAQRLQEKFAKHNLRGLRHVTTVSIGIAHTSSDKFKDYRDLYEAADKALHEAKLMKNTIRIYSKRKVYHKAQLPLIG